MALATALAVTAAGEQRAQALQGGEDPALLPTLLDKRYGLGGRHNIALSFSTSLVTKFVEGAGPSLAYQYMFNDIIGFEISGSYFFSDETNIMKEVRVNFPGMEHPPLSDLFQMQWNANLDLVLVPFYGKLSLASEVDPAFDMFLVVGGGAAGTRRAEGPPPPDGPTGHTTSIAPVFNAGIGFRFLSVDPWLVGLSAIGGPVGLIVYWVLDSYDVLPKADYNGLGLRFEFRDYFYLDPGEDQGGLTNHLQFQVGLQFMLGEYD